MREELLAQGYCYIREVIPGASQNKTQRLYFAVCAQFEAWDNEKIRQSRLILNATGTEGGPQTLTRNKQLEDRFLLPPGQ